MLSYMEKLFFSKTDSCKKQISSTEDRMVCVTNSAADILPQMNNKDEVGNPSSNICHFELVYAYFTRS